MPDSQKIELLSDATNEVVARYVERNYPGVLIQGDTLKILFDDLEELQEEIAGGDMESAKEISDVIQEKLLDLLTHYETVLSEHGIELPYFGAVSSR